MTEFAPANPSSEQAAPKRVPYVAPLLVKLGELRDITLGASPGIGDSGGSQPQRCPGCP